MLSPGGALRKKVADSYAKGSRKPDEVQCRTVPDASLDAAHIAATDVSHISQGLL